jgi:hypothetical protein
MYNAISSVNEAESFVSYRPESHTSSNPTLERANPVGTPGNLEGSILEEVTDIRAMNDRGGISCSQVLISSATGGQGEGWEAVNFANFKGQTSNHSVTFLGRLQQNGGSGVIPSASQSVNRDDDDSSDGFDLRSVDSEPAPALQAPQVDPISALLPVMMNQAEFSLPDQFLAYIKKITFEQQKAYQEILTRVQEERDLNIRGEADSKAIDKALGKEEASKMCREAAEACRKGIDLLEKSRMSREKGKAEEEKESSKLGECYNLLGISLFNKIVCKEEGKEEVSRMYGEAIPYFQRATEVDQNNNSLAASLEAFKGMVLIWNAGCKDKECEELLVSEEDLQAICQ